MGSCPTNFCRGRLRRRAEWDCLLLFHELVSFLCCRRDSVFGTTRRRLFFLHWRERRRVLFAPPRELQRRKREEGDEKVKYSGILFIPFRKKPVVVRFCMSFSSLGAFVLLSFSAKDKCLLLRTHISQYSQTSRIRMKMSRRLNDVDVMQRVTRLRHCTY